MKSHRKLFKMLLDGELEAVTCLALSRFEAGLLSAADIEAELE